MRDDNTASLFIPEIAARNDDVNKADGAQRNLLLMKETWIKSSKQGCGIPKVHYNKRRFGGGIELWLPNEWYATEPG